MAEDLAARLSAATGLEAYPYPPPSLIPPCVVLLPGVNYVAGPRRTGCVVDVEITARIVSDVHESSGAFAQVDDLVCSALEVLSSFTAVNIGARNYGDARFWCADITVTETAPIERTTLARLLVAPT